MALIAGILCILVSVVVFIFADGLRRSYSGIFFVFMGVLMLVQSQRWRRRRDK